MVTARSYLADIFDWNLFLKKQKKLSKIVVTVRDEMTTIQCEILQFVCLTFAVALRRYELPNVSSRSRSRTLNVSSMQLIEFTKS